jgi:hypothetical protein
MMHKITQSVGARFFLLMSITCCFQTHAITVVYNLRIAEPTRNQAKLFKNTHAHVAVATPYCQFRKNDLELWQSIGGVLGAYIFSLESWYARVQAAVGHVHAKDLLTVDFSKTQMDDILFSGGYGHAVNERLRMTFTVHLGIPMHNDTALEEPIECGTGHVGIGAQIDGSFQYAKHHAVTGAMRFIHFFPRMVTAAVGPLRERFKFNIGNIADLFFAYQTSWKLHRFEIGYNPTFVFDSTIYPPLPLAVEEARFIVNSFFATYQYAFVIRNLPNAISFGISYGFDNIPECMNNKYIVTSWFSWGVNF